MKNTTFISAGAGSGKTYRLTQEIAQMIIDGKCCAEEIILTTFTETAAKELREKVRSTLYSKGLYEAAMNIDNAAIGTIHSIAYQFVSRYWYLLGVSANVSIMDTEGSKLCISQSLASLPTEEDLWLFDTMCRSFNLTVPQTSQLDFGFWERELKSIIDKTVELCIDEKQLEEAREESKKLLGEVLKWTTKNLTGDDVNIILDYADESLKVCGDQKKRKSIESNINAVKSCKDVCIHLQGIYSLAKVIKGDAKTKKKHPHIAAYFEDLYDSLPSSVQVKDYIEAYIDTIFRLAIKWKGDYEEFKRERCLLDFSDLLQKFDELLNKRVVEDDIRSRYKVAFVDEFQDCSPLQVRSFSRLSELMGRSVWVGDIKQAIYGFRGTNIELINSVINEVKQKKDGNKPDSLKHCWRSNKTIVDLVNNVFCKKVFNGQKEEYIKLDMPVRTESDPPKPAERKLQHWHFIDVTPRGYVGKKNIFEELVKKVKKLIESKTYKANEIAILCRYNSNVKDCAKALKSAGISYNVKLDNDYSDKDNQNADDIASFINAVVAFAARGDNELSKAIIVNRIEQGYDASKIVSDKLQFEDAKTADENKKNEVWLNDMDIVSRFAQIRNAIGNQNVSAAIETIIVELNLCDLIKRIAPNAPAYNYCSELVSKAATYEGVCRNFGLSSTLVGFVDYLQTHPVEYPGDDNGVAVMTYHKSKGLEWPCVILCSLGNAPVDADKTFFGVLTYNTADETKLCLIPSAMRGVCKNLMDNFWGNEFFQKLSEATTEEAKRLMYVGMTRPKEQLILTTTGSNDSDKWLTAIGCDNIDYSSTASIINWGGADWLHSIAMEQENKVPEAAEFDVLKQPAERKSFAEKFVSPSKAKSDAEKHKAELFATFAERLSIKSADAKDSTVGNFIHHAMCLWNGEKSVVESLAAAYGVAVDIDCVVATIEKFWSWMEQTYGKPSLVERELPFCYNNEQGQVVTGEIDLVYHTADGAVLIDYKTYQGSVANLTDETSKFYAGKKYGGQLELYKTALMRNGNTVRESLICYLSLGAIVKVK